MLGPGQDKEREREGEHVWGSNEVCRESQRGELQSHIAGLLFANLLMKTFFKKSGKT